MAEKKAVTAAANAAGAAVLCRCKFEVFGKVQGVFFRKFTEDKGKELDLKGWVQNTKAGTVIGEAEGPCDKVKTFKEWISKIGSPQSRIDRCDFTNERNDLAAYSFKNFVVKK